MSGLAGIKQRLQQMAQIGMGVKRQLEQLKGSGGAELRERAKAAGTRMGIGAGIALFGVAIVAVAAVYIVAVLILLLNIALDRLWLSALIVVLGLLLLGAAIAVIGLGIVRKAAKEVPKLGENLLQPIKQAGDEMKEAAEDLQAMAKEEARERRQQALALLEPAKKYIPYAIGAYVGYRVLKRVARSRRARKRIMREAWEEV